MYSSSSRRLVLEIGRNLGNLWIRIVILLVLFIGAYWVAIKGIVDTWIENDDYSYGFLIPIISLYLFWDKRQYLRSVEVRSCWAVFPLLVFFVLLSLYGILGSSGNISRPAIPILIILFSAFYLGLQVVRKAILPLAFLIFMVPLPAVLDRSIGVFLKSLSSTLGGAFIRLFGMTVYVSGNIIDLGVTQLQVVDACSGLRFVFPLVALGVVYSYFFEHILWKRVFCVLVTIPIAVFTNVLRIGITGILTNLYGVEMAQGFFHGFSGWAIFMVAFGFLFVFGRILSLFPPRHGKSPDRQEAKPALDAARLSTRKNSAAFWVSAVMLIGVGALTWSTSALPRVDLKDGISHFPLEFTGWRGRSVPVEPDIILASGAEEAFNGIYTNARGESVSLYIGYRGSAFLENENFFHSPTVCLPSSGWKTKYTSKRIVSGVPRFGNLPVTQMVIENLGSKQLVYFWFQTKDKVTHDKNINRFHLALDAIHKRNTYDLFIRVITSISNGKGQDTETGMSEAQVRLDSFTREMMGTLLKFLGG